MKTIKITLPATDKQKYLVQISRSVYRKKNAASALSLIRKQLNKRNNLALSNGTTASGTLPNEQYYILVDYSAARGSKRLEFINDAEAKTSTEALFTLEAFLEDLL